ncbi:MAG: CDP-alcohol phosphatidyltransferase family protein [Bacteroidia bacterium]|nr:CDP-alcohol phosphatidyltransferase family protein [Bacteroidia bacterium]
MVSVYQLKPRFQQMLIPVLKSLHKQGVTPNFLTLSAVFLSFLIGLSVGFTPQMPVLIWMVPGGLLLRMALNALDGMMARTYQMQSKTGEVLNEIGDVVSDIMVYLPLVILMPEWQLLLVLFVLMSVINEFAGVLGKVLGGERRYDGPMGKSDRAFTIGLACLLTGIWPGFVEYFPLVIGVALLLVLVSTGVRLKKSVI